MRIIIATSIWNALPANVDAQPARIWDWRQPQFLAGLLPPPFPASVPLLPTRTPIDFTTRDAERYLWYGWDREEANLQLFLTLRISAAITVSLIILLAGFGIFNVLTMSVLSKIKEIAILRSMGYRARDISSIFLWQGAMIAVAGSLIRCLVGALFTWDVSHIPIRVRGLIYANHFLVTWDWRHYFWATILAIIAVFIASYVPARRAPRLERVRCAAGEISRQIQFATARPLPPLLIASFPGL